MGYAEDKKYENVDFVTEDIRTFSEYENCVFINCNFYETDISHIKFTECEFRDCNLSMAKTHDTAFRDVSFKNCKMLGLRFDSCNQFGLAFTFENCNLSHSSFFQNKIRKTKFYNCHLEGVDFAQSDLSSTSFDECNLNMAIFDNTIIEKADFRNASGFQIDPESNYIKKARFSTSGLPGLLTKYNIDVD